MYHLTVAESSAPALRPNECVHVLCSLIGRVKQDESAATLVRANACGPNSCGAGRPTADHGVIYDADRRLRGAG